MDAFDRFFDTAVVVGSSPATRRQVRRRLSQSYSREVTPSSTRRMRVSRPS